MGDLAHNWKVYSTNYVCFINARARAWIKVSRMTFRERRIRSEIEIMTSHQQGSTSNSVNFFWFSDRKAKALILVKRDAVRMAWLTSRDGGALCTMFYSFLTVHPASRDTRAYKDIYTPRRSLWVLELVLSQDTRRNTHQNDFSSSYSHSCSAGMGIGSHRSPTLLDPKRLSCWLWAGGTSGMGKRLLRLKRDINDFPRWLAIFPRRVING